jgi:hypothetical protein
MANNRASRSRNFDGPITGVVVENINGRVRQRRTKILDDRGNGNFFIKTRDKNSYTKGLSITF